MFSRVASSGHVCLRCQRYHVHYSSPWRSPEISAISLYIRRWQSGIATRLEDDYLDDTNGHNEPHISATPREIRSPLKYRHWRPHTAADLGVEALGKPAEVLILPSRRHKTPRTLSAQAESKNHGIQESLDSELQPVSWEDIAKNLEAMQADFIEDSRASNIVDLNKLREEIASGFSQKQLKQYLRRAMSTISEEDFEKQLPSPQSKRNLAEHISTQVWGLKSASQNFETNTLDLSRFSKAFKSSPECLELVLLDRNEPFRQLSERHKVQVDIFRERSEVALEGEQEAVLAAYKDLKQILKKPVSYTIELDHKTRELLNVPGVQDDFIRAFMSKYLVHIKREKDVLRVASRDKHAVKFVHRDLRMAVQEYRHSKLSLLPTTHPDTIAKVPIYPLPARNWFTEQLSWRRLSAQAVKSGESERPQELQTEVLKNISKRVFDSFTAKHIGSEADYRQKTSGSFDAVRPHYSADLGHILFNEAETQQPGKKGSQLLSESSRPTFSSEIPMLPQTLSRMAERSGLVYRSSNIIILRLQPTDTKESLPCFEVHMTGNDIERGLRQPLRICKVSAIYRKQSFGLLLPYQGVDIRVNRNATSTLFSIADGSPHNALLPFLKSLAYKLESVQLSESGKIPPFWILDLTQVLQRSSFNSTRQSSPGSSLRKASRAPSKPGNRSETDLSSCKYMLEPPEYLDVCSYRAPAQSEYFIDHILADAGPTDLPQHHEILRVVESPLSSSNGVVAAEPSVDGDDADRFQTFLKSAVDTALLLSRPPGAQDKR